MGRAIRKVIGVDITVQQYKKNLQEKALLREKILCTASSQEKIPRLKPSKLFPDRKKFAQEISAKKFLRRKFEPKKIVRLENSPPSRIKTTIAIQH